MFKNIRNHANDSVGDNRKGKSLQKQTMLLQLSSSFIIEMFGGKTLLMFL